MERPVKKITTDIAEAALEHEIQNGPTFPPAYMPPAPPEMYAEPIDMIEEAMTQAAEEVREAVEASPGEIPQSDLISTLAASSAAMRSLLDRVQALHERLVGPYEGEGWPSPGSDEVASMPIFMRIRHESYETARTALAIRAVLDSIEAGLRN